MNQSKAVYRLNVQLYLAADEVEIDGFREVCEKLAEHRGYKVVKYWDEWDGGDGTSLELIKEADSKDITTDEVTVSPN